MTFLWGLLHKGWWATSQTAPTVGGLLPRMALAYAFPRGDGTLSLGLGGSGKMFRNVLSRFGG